MEPAVDFSPSAISNDQEIPPGATSAPLSSGASLPLLQNPGLSSSQQETRRISDDEIALYDRQIRLWGMSAQNRIRNARVLLITLGSLGNEIAKNLVLAGIGSLTVLDHKLISESDFGAQFLLSQETSPIGTPRVEAAKAQIQALNPRVAVAVDADDVKNKNTAFFKDFDIIIATDLLPPQLNTLNTYARLHGKCFYAAGVHGLYGFVFSDLIDHKFTIKRKVGNVTTKTGPETRSRSVVDVQVSREDGVLVEHVTKLEKYSTWYLAWDMPTLSADITRSKRRLRAVSPILSCLRGLWDFQQTHGRSPSIAAAEDFRAVVRAIQHKHNSFGLPPETLRADTIRQFVQNIGCELMPVAAVVGGHVAQDVINVLGQNQQSLQNMLVFDGETCEGSVYSLLPEGELGGEQLKSSRTDQLGAVAAELGQLS
ncbi:hypothetical protein TD95_002928 [Thielaviopsis punctulata]|uniref:THIF-type NAD/FAD binding fold domain-containing protein n=1 Tax=Thielaviopsis punctulata TaxID=72032 RepID=A0A0F4Z9V4_9PEZI|nr:hypothetical protein TD95_002928 [Thielaviopsis punctulata]